MTEAAIFAGAGASLAVNSNQYPTTTEFMSRLPDAIKQQPLFRECERYLSSRQESPDIEKLLWLVNEAKAFAENSPSKSFVHHLIHGQALKTIVGMPDDALKHFVPKMSDLTTKANSLIHNINREVYNQYGSKPDREALRTNWEPLLEIFSPTEFDTLDIFTTNYDRVLEAAIRYLSPGIDVGHVDDVDRILNLDRWKLGYRVTERGLLTKLHGSVDWIRGGGDDIFISDPSFKSDHGRHVILYPGFKGMPTTSPFNLFHQYFKNKLKTASVVLLVGFAFRDDYINEILRESTNREALVIILNPGDLQDIPYAIGKYIHIKALFDTSGIEKVRNALRTSGSQVQGDRNLRLEESASE